MNLVEVVASHGFLSNESSDHILIGDARLPERGLIKFEEGKFVKISEFFYSFTIAFTQHFRYLKWRYSPI